MSSNFEFSFVVDKPSHSVFISKSFSAPLSLVWSAFTQPEILDMWGAPPPFVQKTKYMDFVVGGKRLYSMVSPEGQEQWSIQEFTAIRPMTHFQMLTNFADKDGNINTHFKSSENNVDFGEVNLVTTVKMAIRYASPEVLEMMIARGFREGMTMAMNNLETVLAGLSKQHSV